MGSSCHTPNKAQLSYYIVTLRFDGGIRVNVRRWPLRDLLRWAVPRINCPALAFLSFFPLLLCVWWQTGTSSAVITNLIRAEVRLMRKTEASTALLINSCPIMVPGRRHWAKNETFSFLFPPLSVLLPRSPPIMNSLLGPNYIQGCIRSTAGPVETSAEFPLRSPPLHSLLPCWRWPSLDWILNVTPPPPPHTHTPSSVVPYLHQFWTHMWFMMEAGGNVCLLLAVLHLITACTDRVACIHNVGWVGQIGALKPVCVLCPCNIMHILVRTLERESVNCGVSKYEWTLMGYDIKICSSQCCRTF